MLSESEQPSFCAVMEGPYDVKPILALTLAFLLIGIAPLRATAGETSRLSLDTASGDSDGPSSGVAVSSDGNYVVFQSTATDLVAPATNGASQIFRRNTLTGTTILVSTDGGGTQGNGDSFEPAISPDGNLVAFASNATNLIGGADTNGVSDVFLRDITGGTTVRVSVATGGGQADGDSTEPAIAVDGPSIIVSFTSDATDLIGGADTNLQSDVYVHTLPGVTTERVSVGPGGIEGDKDSFQSSLSADGNLVAFATESDNFFEVDDDWVDIFVRNRLTATTEMLSVTSKGTGSDAPSFGPSISGDGRFVAFQSFTTNLISGDKNALGDILLRDRQTDVTTRVSVDSAGAEGTGAFPGIDGPPSISADGRFITFHSSFTNLVPDDTNICGLCFTPGCCEDVFVHDTLSGRVERVSVDDAGGQASARSVRPAIAADGKFIAFESDATDLTAGDGNALRDTFGRTPVCGDGQLDRGESCDDGNLIDGDGCSSTCELTCVTLPQVGCRQVASEKGRLLIKDKLEDRKDKLIWKWLKGAITPKADFGNPLVDESYVFCMYDGAGLAMSSLAPAGGLCSGKPCWKDKPKGFQYKDKDLTPEGINLMKLSAGVEPGKAKILVKSKGENLQLPDLTTLVSPVTIQLVNNAGICWETVFTAPFQQQDAGSFKDKSD